MAKLSDARKLDIVFKTIVGRRETTTDKAWYEEYPAKLFNPHDKDIWIDPIPPTPPTESTAVIEIWNDHPLTEDMSTANHRAWLTCSTPNDTSTHVGEFIPPIYGQGYTVRIYDNTGTEIPTAHPVRWYFSYTSGVLVFEEDPTMHGLSLPIKIKAYRYIGRKGVTSNAILEIDGGTAQETYAAGQAIDGGGASTTYLPSQVIDGGGA